MNEPWRDMLREVEVGEPIAADGLQVFGLRWGREDALVYRTLDEALASGSFEVAEVNEAGVVRFLKVTNKSDRHVFLPAGEQLVGAKQNRVVNASVMIGSKSEVVIDVTCVEARRWGYTSRFLQRSPSSSHSKLRQMMLRQSKAALHRLGRPESDQEAVWQEVDRKLNAMGSKSRTADLTQAYVDHAARLDRLLTQLSPPAECCGAAFAVGGEVVGVELFDKPATFAKLWHKLGGAYIIDALEIPVIGRQVSRDEVTRWFDAVRNSRTDSFKSAGLGEDVRIEGPHGDGACLVVEGQPVHLELFPRSSAPYAMLRPDTWRQAHPEAIREYRVTERRDRAERKQYRRAARRRNRANP